MTTAERGFHPFAVLHVLRKTILLYLIPLVQVLFERNWQALWTALVQDAVLFTVLALVSAASGWSTFPVHPPASGWTAPCGPASWQR